MNSERKEIQDIVYHSLIQADKCEGIYNSHHHKGQNSFL